MIALRLETDGAFSKRVLAAGNAAYGAWVRAAQWAIQHKAGDVVPLTVARRIGGEHLWDRLESAGLCARAEKGYVLLPDPDGPTPPVQGALFPAEPSAARPETTFAARKATLGGAGPKTPKVDQVGGYAALVDAYHWAFKATHGGTAPIISARTGRAAKQMLSEMPLADAIACVKAAFDDAWFVRTSSELHVIAASPNRYRVVKPAPVEARTCEPLTPEMRARGQELVGRIAESLKSRLITDDR